MGCAVDFQFDRGRGDLIRSALDLKRLQNDALGHLRQLFGHDHFKIFFVDLFLLIGESLEPLEGVIDLCLAKPVTQFFQTLTEGMAPGQLAHHHLAFHSIRSIPGA